MAGLYVEGRLRSTILRRVRPIRPVDDPRAFVAIYENFSTRFRESLPGADGGPGSHVELEDIVLLRKKRKGDG